MNRVAVFLLAAALAAGASACRKKDPEQPAVATPSVTLNHDRAPLGSPLDITYKWTVANDAKFDEDYRVMMHVMDTDGKNVIQVTSGPMQEIHPSFSPDGTRLVYCAMSNRSNQWELWTVNLSTSERRMI